MICYAHLSELRGTRMSLATVEERLTILEQKVAGIIPDEQELTLPKTAWWKKIVGIYKEDPDFC